jgi:hypothetical protein
MRGLFTVVIAGVAIAAAGCSDFATAPATDRDLAPDARPSLNYGSDPVVFSGFRSTTFRLTSAGGKFAIGDLFKLNVPADAVCEIRTYNTWNTWCNPLDWGESILVTATYGFSNGVPVVDFSPDLRFAGNKTVTLSTDFYSNILTTHARYFEDNKSALRGFAINYTSDLGGTTTIDAAHDSTLITHVNLRYGIVWRRVKHFSGYSVATGRACDPNSGDPDCVAVPTPELDQ